MGGERLRRYAPELRLSLPRAMPWADGLLAFQAVCQLHADNHKREKQFHSHQF